MQIKFEEKIGVVLAQRVPKIRHFAYHFNQALQMHHALARPQPDNKLKQLLGQFVGNLSPFKTHENSGRYKLLYDLSISLFPALLCISFLLTHFFS